MANYKNLCMGCMRNIGDKHVCPYCGYDENQGYEEYVLKPGTILQDKYIVGKKVYVNAENICYIGYDKFERSVIYIKEFYLKDISSREGNKVVTDESNNDKFLYYKENFLKYFRSMAKVRDISAFLPVYDILKENNTVYVISEAVEGLTLYEFVKQSGGRISWNTAKPMFMPLLSALDRLSLAGIQHLGLSPETLIIDKEKKIHVIGFSTKCVRQYGWYSEPELFDGFAAPEQYDKDSMVGVTADIYGFTATLFFALTGIVPQSSKNRLIDDRILIPIKVLNSIPQNVVTALATGLKVNVLARQQTFEELRKHLSAPDEILHPMQEDEVKESKKNTALWIIIPAIVVLFILIAIWFLFFGTDAPKKESNNSQEDSSITYQTPDQIVVPNLVGLNFEQEKKEAEAIGEYQVLQSEKQFSDEIPEGCIISQTPTRGSYLNKGGTIVVEVSKGPEYKNLPEVAGLSLADASILLSSQGFIPSKDEESSTTVPAGMVIGYKNNNAGDKVQQGATVTIVVSKG